MAVFFSTLFYAPGLRKYQATNDFSFLVVTSKQGRCLI